MFLCARLCRGKRLCVAKTTKEGDMAVARMIFEARVEGQTVGRLIGYRKEKGLCITAGARRNFPEVEMAKRWLLGKIDKEWTQVSLEGEVWRFDA